MSPEISSYRVEPGGRVRGELRPPGDKSISHRAVMLAAVADGNSTVDGFLSGADCLRTLAAFEAMGVAVQRESETRLAIQGVGIDGLRAPAAALDLGNSGTSMRLLAGLLAGQRFASTLVGDESLSRRPMLRIVDPLRQMGARIGTASRGTAPLSIRPSSGLHGIEYASPVASAQVKSGLLLAGLYARGTTRISEPGISRDHSERMLRSFGVVVDSAPRQASVRGGQRLRATAVRVPADLSSAAFLLVAASIAADSDLLLREVGVNPTRTGIISILRRMGADITVSNRRDFGAEPVADLRVRSARLRGVEIDASDVAAAIDELPILFVAAACAQGRTQVRGAAELRVKESDRIQAMCDALQALGARVQPLADGAIIDGGALDGGRVDSCGDHRVAMSLAVAALRCRAPVTVGDVENVDTSFPRFAGVLGALGPGIRRIRDTPIHSSAT